jgi:hypothetical protein
VNGHAAGAADRPAPPAPGGGDVRLGRIAT